MYLHPVLNVLLGTDTLASFVYMLRIPTPLLAITLLALQIPLLCSCSRKDTVAKVSARGDSRVQPVEVLALLRQNLDETLTVVGSLAPNESAELRPEIVGLIKKINFEEGMTVKTGQLLVKIDDAELRAQLAQSEARFQLAELSLQRAEALRLTQSNTQADADRARSEFAAAKAERALLRLRIEKTEIKAPFDGIVGGRSISIGDYVTTQSIITTIDDLSRLKVDFQVPERALSKVHQGTQFVVSSSAIGRDDTQTPIRGEVYFVSSIIERSTRSSQIKGLLNNPPAKLKPGMFANIEVVLDVRRGVLTVPEGSILSTATGTSLILVKEEAGNKVAEFVPVRLGLRARGLVEVESLKGTLSEGQLVVASGVGGLILYPGAKLEPKPLKERFRSQTGINP